MARHQVYKPGPAPQGGVQVQQGGMRVEQYYVGPVPAPELLREFDAIRPGAAELFFDIYKQQSTERLAKERMLVEGKVAGDKRGQVFAFTLAAGGLALALAFGLLGLEGAALASIIGGISPVVLATVTGLLRGPRA